MRRAAHVCSSLPLLLPMQRICSATDVHTSQPATQHLQLLHCISVLHSASADMQPAASAAPAVLPGAPGAPPVALDRH